MQLWIVAGRLCLALGAFAPLTAAAAVVYKWTDASGVVHYSDQPAPGAEKIVTSSNSANGVGGQTRSPSLRPVQAAATPGRMDYKTIVIESPVKDQVFFGDEIVAVRLRLEPTLKPKQEIVWKLNGTPLADQGPTAVSLSLPSLARGTYDISATVTDSETGETQTSDSVTFFVRQPSALAPLNPLRTK